MFPPLPPSCRRVCSLGLALSSLVTTMPVTPVYPPATQCGSFTVNWAGSNVTTGLPFSLLILPLDAPPTISKLSNSSFDATTKTRIYTLDKLPLKSGAQFVVAMDDGYGVFVSTPDTFRPPTQPSRPFSQQVRVLEAYP